MSVENASPKPSAVRTGLSTGQRFAIMIGAFVAGLAVFAALALQASSRVAVNGPIYQRIAANKDMVADILPPDAFAIEAYLTALQLPDASDRPALAGHLDELGKKFEASHQGWAKRLPPGPIADAAAEAHRTGSAFLDVLRREVLPPLLAGNDAAGRQALTKVGAVFKAHREAIDRLAELGDKATAADEAEAKASLSAFVWKVLLLAGLVALAVGLLAAAIARRLQRSLHALAAQAATISGGVMEGRLNVRGDAGQVDAEFRPIVEGMNETMEAFAKPLAMTVEYVTRTSKGDIPPKITDEYRGDFNQIKDAFNTCIDAVNALVADAGILAKAAVEGRLATRADAGRHQGDFRRIVEGVNAAIEALVGHLDAMPVPGMVVDRDLKVLFMNAAALHVAGKSKAEVLGQRCSDLFRTGDCTTERCACSRAMREDRVASSETVARPSSGEYEIAYSANPIRDGDKVIGAFEMISDQTAVKSALRATQKVSDFQGRCTSRVVTALEALSRGDLTADATIESGDQDTADAARSFGTIGAAISRSVEAVRALTADADRLAQAAVAGQLKTRADAGKHQGDFKKIVEGVNQTLDAVMAPIDESARVLELLAGRDLRARVHGKFQGDHARIKESVNGTAWPSTTRWPRWPTPSSRSPPPPPRSPPPPRPSPPAPPSRPPPWRRPPAPSTPSPA